MTDQGARPDPEDGPPEGTEGSGGTSREAAWDDVAARFSNLGKQVRSRFDQPRQTPPGSQEPSAAGGDSVRRWLDTLDATFTKLGDTVRDPQFRKEAGSSVSRLGEALGVTLRDLGEQLQSKFAARQDTSHVGAGDPMPDVPPPPAAPGAGDPAGPAGPAGPTGGPPPPTPGSGGPAADAPPVTPPADAPPASPGAGAEPPADDERPPTL